jgi:HSP20 family protein
MALVRRNRTALSPVQTWDLGSFGELFDDFERFLGQTTFPTAARFEPMMGYFVDLYETDQHLVLEMAVPGVKVEDLDISIENRQLTITGTLPALLEDEKRRYWLQSIPHGQFSRTFTLPVTVETEGIEATVRDGLLSLTMPKVAQARARKIAISE